MKPFTGHRCPAADIIHMPLGTSQAIGCEWGKTHVHRGFPTEGQPQALQISAFDFGLSVHGFTAPMQLILRARAGKGSFGSQPIPEFLPRTLVC